MRRVEWWWFRPSTTTGCRDNRQNVKESAILLDVLPIISATNDGRRTRLPPFEPSRCDESNGGGFVLLPPLDAEIIGETSKYWPFYRRFADYLGN